MFIYIATIVIKSTGLNNLFRKTNPSLARLVDVAARAVGTANLALDPPQVPEPRVKKGDDIIANDPHDDYISDDDDDMMGTQNAMLPQTLQFPDGVLKKPEGNNI
jgi:hypothetical protein